MAQNTIVRFPNILWYSFCAKYQPYFGICYHYLKKFGFDAKNVSEIDSSMINKNLGYKLVRLFTSAFFVNNRTRQLLYFLSKYLLRQKLLFKFFLIDLTF